MTAFKRLSRLVKDSWGNSIVLRREPKEFVIGLHYANSSVCLIFTGYNEPNPVLSSVQQTQLEVTGTVRVNKGNRGLAIWKQ